MHFTKVVMQVPGVTNVDTTTYASMQAAIQEQANKLFASISEANTVLSDPTRRGEVRTAHRAFAAVLQWSAH